MGRLGLARRGAVLGVILVLLPVPLLAQALDVLLVPKTLVDRAIEARSMSDIAKDNEIVLKVNKLMADIGTIQASTRIYEQRLLITGVFDDRAKFEAFQKGVRAIKDVKKLYWHVIYMPQQDQSRRKLLDWGDVVLLETKTGGRLIAESGVADVNFRTAADAFGTLYVMGRARSDQERSKALARARDDGSVKRVVHYVEVRP